MGGRPSGDSLRSLRARVLSIARRTIAGAAYCAFTLGAASILTFLLLESSPALRRAVGATEIRFWGLREEFVSEPDLVLSRRKRSTSHAVSMKGDLFREAYGIETPTISMVYDFDEYGFRNGAVSPPVEILVIGDSYVEFGESNADTLSARLARTTGRTTFNLGHSWYGPHQYVELLRRHAPRLKPAVAIYCHFDGNDSKDVREYTHWRDGGAYYDWGTARLGFRPHFATAAKDVARFVHDRIRDAVAVTRNEVSPSRRRKVDPRVAWVDIGGHEVAMRFAYYPRARSANRLLKSEHWKTLGEQLTEFREWSDEHGIDSVAVYIPTKFQVYARHIGAESGERVRRRTTRLRPFEDAPFEAFDALAEAAGIPVIDLTPEFRRRAGEGETLYYPFDSHWNSAGREAAAHVIARDLGS